MLSMLIPNHLYQAENLAANIRQTSARDKLKKKPGIRSWLIRNNFMTRAKIKKFQLESVFTKYFPK